MVYLYVIKAKVFMEISINNIFFLQAVEAILSNVPEWHPSPYNGKKGKS